MGSVTSSRPLRALLPNSSLRPIRAFAQVDRPNRKAPPTSKILFAKSDAEQRVDVARIERQGAFKKAAPMVHVLEIISPVEPFHTLQRIKVRRVRIRSLFRPRRASAEINSDLVVAGEAGDDLVLHFEEISQRFVEAVGPKVIAGLCVHELHVHSHAMARIHAGQTLRARSGRQAPCRFPERRRSCPWNVEGGVARDHESAAEARGGGRWLDSRSGVSAK